MSEQYPRVPDSILPGQRIVTIAQLYNGGRNSVGATACVVVDRETNQHYVVSSVVAYSGFETLVFRSTPSGEVTDWMDVAGGQGMSREEAIADLTHRLEAEGES